MCNVTGSGKSNQASCTVQVPLTKRLFCQRENCPKCCRDSIPWPLFKEVRSVFLLLFLVFKPRLQRQLRLLRLGFLSSLFPQLPAAGSVYLPGTVIPRSQNDALFFLMRPTVVRLLRPFLHRQRHV